MQNLETIPLSQFRDMLDMFRLCYPAEKSEHVDWEARVLQYHRGLGRYPANLLSAALSAAISRHPSFFPSLGQIQGIADEIRRRRVKLAAQQRDMAERKQLAQTIEAERERIPWELEKAKRYINAAPNKFERLGRIWEMEAKRLKLKPGSKESQEFNLARLRELGELLASHRPTHEDKHWRADIGFHSKPCTCREERRAEGRTF